MPENNGKFYREQAWENIYRRFDSVDEEIKEIKENHLVHIYNEISDIKQRLAYYAGAITIVVVLAQWLLSKL